jgi:hypothetical protein
VVFLRPPRMLRFVLMLSTCGCGNRGARQLERTLKFAQSFTNGQAKAHHKSKCEHGSRVEKEVVSRWKNFGRTAVWPGRASEVRSDVE